jgi:hypothetical protein
MLMIEPQGESSLPPSPKARGMRGVMKLDQGFAEGKRQCLARAEINTKDEGVAC